MLFLVDFAPLLLFLGGYFYKDLYFAIVVLMISMPIGLAIKYKMTGKLDKMLMWSTVFLFVFGGASLYLRDPQFLFWKPTALYWAMALAFFASQWIGEKPLVKRFFDLLGELPTDHITDGQIRRLNLIWGAFFVLVGIANLVVAYNFSENFWVNFKVFGLTALTFVFMSVQIYWIVSKLGPEADDQEAN
jgi:intracellular septation protein